MTKKTPTHCRLSVYLARDARVGVILRRGPSAWAQLSLWDRATDEITPGQWFHGRVYERRCDVSPDGRLFIYIATKQFPFTGMRADIGEAWTAISRPPYITALVLWPNLGTWYGGGTFASDRRVLLDTTCSNEPHPDFTVRGLKYGRIPAHSSPFEQRLLRDGWQLKERGFQPRNDWRVGPRELWEKPHPDGRTRLIRERTQDYAPEKYGGPYIEDFWLECGDNLHPLAGANWADWDGGDRLVLVRRGALYRARFEHDRLDQELIYDFNPLTPTTRPAPAWARRF